MEALKVAIIHRKIYLLLKIIFARIIYSEEKDIWIHYNDSIKEEVKKREVEEFSQNSSEPYLLFYKKI